MKKQPKSHLGLSHHRHTGHILPRKTTSYPVLVMLLLCVGVFLAGWTRLVTAAVVTRSDSYVVHASVPGPPPSVAATIDNPHNGEVFTATPISVNGTCPLSTYVVLYRNDFMSGVALCDALGSYHLTSDLFVGTNKLKAVDYSFTDVAGPDSPITTVYYQPPSPSSSGGGTTSGGQTPTSHAGTGSKIVAPSNPLLLKSDFAFQGFYVGQEIVWQLIVEGGDAPYAIAVDWGDGTHGLISRSAAGSFTFNHTYKKSGGYHGSYAPTFSVTDSKGQPASLQLLAIVSNRPSPVVGSNYSGNTLGGLASIGGKSVGRFLKYVWPSYAVVVLMLISYWLGERREYQYLRPRLKKSRHA